MPDLLTGRGVQRRGAVPGREMRPGREPADVTDLDQQPGRTRRPDAGNVPRLLPVAASSSLSSLFAVFLRW